MRRIVGAIALCALASCSQLAGSGIVAQAQQACVTVQPILNAASVVGDPRVQSIVGYGNAVCGPLAAGQAPASLDANTPTWLGDLGGMLKVLAPIAISLL